VSSNQAASEINDSSKFNFAPDQLFHKYRYDCPAIGKLNRYS